MSIYNFATTDFIYKETKNEIPDTNSYKISQYDNIQTKFSGSGNNALISLIYPRNTKDKELVSVEKTGDGSSSLGFNAVLDNGAEVKYMFAVNGSAELVLPELTVTGESVSLVSSSKGIKGMALGCTGLRINNVNVPPEYADFEFKLVDGRLTDIIPIYKPIGVKSIHVKPDTYAFSDKIKVEMSCDIPDTVLHYTTDGSEPNINSPIYTAPIYLGSTTVVSVKAYRSVVTEEPAIENDSLASRSVVTTFEKKDYLEARDTPKLQNGLKYEYKTGGWTSLYNWFETMETKSSGTVAELFDFSMRDTTDLYYGVAFDGYIDIPMNGVYNFYAPEETYRTSIMAGYKLTLKIDGVTWNPQISRTNPGVWSIPLKAGKHSIYAEFVDYRGNYVNKVNTPGLTKRVWDGITPKLEMSGPSIVRGPIRSDMLFTEK